MVFLPSFCNLMYDVSLASAFQRVAIEILRKSIHNILNSLSPSTPYLEKQVYLKISQQESKKHQTVQQSIQIINKISEKYISQLIPDLDGPELLSISLTNTKQIIKDLIQQETIRFTQDNYSFAKVEEKQESIGQKIFEIMEEEKEVELDNEVEERKQMEVEKLQKNQIIEFNDHSGSNSMEEEDQFDSLAETEQFGHFLLGDHPQSIIRIFLINKQIFAEIIWEPRQDDFLPDPSILSVQEIRRHRPRMLVDYYDSFIAQHSQK